MSASSDLDDERGSWKKEARCIGKTSLFFQEQGTEGRPNPFEYDPTAAKALCEECPVQTECLDFALANKEMFGIWGGMTLYERRKEAKRRRAENVSEKHS